LVTADVDKFLHAWRVILEFPARGLIAVFADRAAVTPHLPGNVVGRVCYSGICHTYENFLRQAIGVAKGNKVRGDFTALAKEAEKLLGKPIADSCLRDLQVNIARLVRNALAHNGGEETSQLKAVKHGIPVEDGILQVMPLDTHRLFALLKDRAFRTAEAVVALPGMK
jgi:hypothetical protein